MRVSTGPAINVMLRGRAACPVSDISAMVATSALHGWQTPTTWPPGPDVIEKADDVIDEFVEAETSGIARDVARIVPVGDVDVVVRQERRDRVAQQGREMTRHRRHQQDARLHDVDSLFEMKKRAERRDERGLFRDRDHTMAHDHVVDAERRPLMRQPCAAHHLGARRHAADKKIAARPRMRLLQQRTGHIGR